jgi:hypothetical protein
MYERIGGRKFAAFLLAWVTLATALFLKFVTGSEFVTLGTLIYATYVSGNVMQKKVAL